VNLISRQLEMMKNYTLIEWGVLVLFFILLSLIVIPLVVKSFKEAKTKTTRGK
jgi:competence protein ComGC